MSRRKMLGFEVSQILLQDALDAGDIIGQWEYDVSTGLAYSDALVALVFNVSPAVAEAGTSIETFIAGIHPEDRDRASKQIQVNFRTGRSCVVEYRVCSADGVTRRVLDRGRFVLDEAGRPRWGSGLLIDVTHRESDDGNYGQSGREGRPPLEQAAEHCLAAKEVLRTLPEPLLNQLSDMLLLELGRSLAKTAGERRRAALN